LLRHDDLRSRRGCSCPLLTSAIPALFPETLYLPRSTPNPWLLNKTLESIHGTLHNMSKAFYITSVSNGLVLAHRPSGTPSGVAVENKGDSGDQEKWEIEAGDEPNVIALKNVSNGGYLHANGGNNASSVGTGAKQWWKISSDNVTAPGACRLSPVDFPMVFLNHFQGKPARQFRDQIKVHMWRWEPVYPYWFSWYFLDANANFNPLASSAAEGSTSNADVEAKVKALEERESALAQKETDRSADVDAKLKALEERESALAQKETDRSADVDAKVKALEERESALAQKETDRSADVDAKLKALEERESALAQKETDRSTDVEAKLKASEERENALTQKETDRSAEWDEKMKAVKEREASSAQEEEKRTASYDERLKDLQDREAALAKREEEARAPDGGSDSDGKANDDEAQAKRESEIQQKLDELSSSEQKLASDQAALERSKSDVTAREKELRQRQKEFEDQKAPAKKEASKNSSQAGQNGASASDKAALEKKQRDNAALEQRLAKLEDRLAQMNRAADAASDKPQANGKVSGKTNGTAPVDEQSSGCGYKHYKPPRKLNRRVIGIVYQ
jgi:hypothetical protein